MVMFLVADLFYLYESCFDQFLQFTLYGSCSRTGKADDLIGVIASVRIAEKQTEPVPGDAEPADEKPSAPAFTGPNAKELKMLHAIASRAAEPELAYATDEDTSLFGLDPHSNRWDMGSDPIEWAEVRMNVTNRRLDNILE